MLPKTTKKTLKQTAPGVNKRIRAGMKERIRTAESETNRNISERLEALDREWDIERVLEANASLLAFSGVALSAAAKNRRWLILPAAVTAFLFQHAVQGWCPPLPVFRRLGYRTAFEIDEERYALKALRGDFENAREDAGEALKAAA